ncbi:MAG: amidohydrolase [Pseudomonadales bacterium]|nr:amidohydrolase [Pseudomonadales bacterium]
MRDLKLSLVQCATHWHDPAANRAAFAEHLAAIGSGRDLILLPEMFSTGFTMDAAGQAETMDGPTVAWMQAQAQALGAAIGGSLVIEDGGAHFNRFVLAHADGRIDHYDKRHLFRMAGEHEHYAPGRRRCIVELHGWRLCPQVCYDLRFPVFSRNRGDYDLLLYVANWPAARAQQWRALLEARAIENQCWLAAVNIVGTDGNAVAYAGGSGVWDPLGRLRAFGAESAQTLHLTLDGETLDACRRSFPVWMDADRFALDADPEAS